MRPKGAYATDRVRSVGLGGHHFKVRFARERAAELVAVPLVVLRNQDS